jgi:short-subunit dehydrogenase
MPTIVVAGAGPGLGLEIARAFGQHGFAVALISRTQSKLEELAKRLADEGIDARGFAADITDADSVGKAFREIRQRYGDIDVVEFSPVDGTLEAIEVLDVQPGNVQPQIDFYVYGAMNVLGEVIPGMVDRGVGTILVTTGGGSITPVPMLANINIAAAALRNWTLNLHNALGPKGVYVAHVAISAWIGSGPPEAEASAIAAEYWNLFETRDRAEHHYVALREDDPIAATGTIA